MKRTWRRYRRLMLAAAFACALVAAVPLALLRERPVTEQLDGILSTVAVMGVAGGIALLAGYFEAYALAERLAWDRFWGPSTLEDPGSDWERWPRPPRQPRPKVLDEPRDSAFWMKRLAARYARLERLEKIAAPEPILAQERRMIRDAIAQLSPEDALAVMRSWPQLAPDHAKKRKGPPVEGSN